MLRSHAVRVLAIPIFFAVGNLSLPPPTGSYSVGQKPCVFDHVSPNDPFWPNNVSTSLLINLYYPTLDTATPVYYIWEGFSKTYDEYFAVPAGSFRDMTANLAFDAHPLPHAEGKKLRLPTLMFGPSGGGPSSRMFTDLLSELASHGYVIITVDQPYEQPYLEYPNGTVFTGVLDLSWSGETFLQEIYDYRLTDNSALLDTMPHIASDTGIPINLTHFVFFGHSVGGTTALSAVLVEINRAESEKTTLRQVYTFPRYISNERSGKLFQVHLYRCLSRTNRLGSRNFVCLGWQTIRTSRTQFSSSKRSVSRVVLA
jgi:hypothetical protein